VSRVHTVVVLKLVSLGKGDKVEESQGATRAADVEKLRDNAARRALIG